MKRGTFNFEVTVEGSLADIPENVEALRRLWLDRTYINGSNLGPGNAGDFDYGAWHVSCHVAGAGGVRQAADGRLLWLEISYDRNPDLYYASLTAEASGRVSTYRLDSPQANALLQGSKLLGFVEGNSTGHISARQVNDPPTRFNSWQRQDFDQPVDSSGQGGKVWEHWCTLRDIRPSCGIANSVLSAYVSLVAALGDQFPPTVARGRRDYSHPTQLCTFVRAGFTSKESATWNTIPMAIPTALEKLLLEARPADALAAVKQLSWADPPCYYMFSRRISHWSSTSAVKQDLQNFGL
jgi:hypothetical protein